MGTLVGELLYGCKIQPVGVGQPTPISSSPLVVAGRSVKVVSRQTAGKVGVVGAASFMRVVARIAVAGVCFVGRRSETRAGAAVEVFGEPIAGDRRAASTVAGLLPGRVAVAGVCCRVMVVAYAVGTGIFVSAVAAVGGRALVRAGAGAAASGATVAWLAGVSLFAA